MSFKNKLQNKKLRKAERSAGDSAWSSFERKPLSGFPRAAAVKVLARPFLPPPGGEIVPPAKQTGSRRRRMKKALSSAILVPRIQPKDPAVKLTQDLQKYPLIRVIRTIKHSARHAATCKYLAEDCTPGSQVQKNLLAAQTHHLSVLRQAQSEYNVRTAPRV